MTTKDKIATIRKEIEKIGTGYGMMTLTNLAVPTERTQAFGAINKVIEIARAQGHKAFFNVGEFYGPNYANLHLVRDFFKEYPNLREYVLISCKGAIDNKKLTPKGKYEEVVASMETCIKEIGVFIDIFEPARLDFNLCKEHDVYPKETLQAVADFVDAGKFGAISLSEVNGEQINAISKDFGDYLVCVEIELSMFRDTILKNGTAKACSDNALPIICYSPLGRGILTGQITKNSDIPDGDFRKKLKYFSDEALAHNQEIVNFIKSEIVEKRPDEKRVTLAQVALAWVRKWSYSSEYPKSKFIPIPSGSSATRVSENFEESKTQLSDTEFEKINEYVNSFSPIGGSYEFI
ncbi:uncharacterized protein GVI51_I01837 [Nakaseomyces glabratus]|uniref:NADP-dependent oxidoreductase domain-containing protein n=2 Tax=Candida glabrata TaxID=5478 RepID=Q6FR04_CANGA|nr:uncharacterized protein CAGL0I02046g [Nakaseomyces glabratus]KAH7599596.1 Aldo/keto reductase family [Nakaseomyces glabratus]KAH7604427.1 Aldo/keto reductase family [Nakaseomyces glabratus]KTB01427.1 putative pyridoxal reductase [Nakaseomyces glabratus]KTB05483.1 putative pyridoxal reductase [Nakaseomyces glabratus]KTB05712.1 putative pyridoxal reductase [Nakaseomyces glabratus]|eukprot:XP_447340.1 uncharacterized protein CAGL0I02046g [[Candida] glabrata]